MGAPLSLSGWARVEGGGGRGPPPRMPLYSTKHDALKKRKLFTIKNISEMITILSDSFHWNIENNFQIMISLQMNLNELQYSLLREKCFKFDLTVLYSLSSL